MSRPKRWLAAINALSELDVGEIESLRDEYQEWRDNLPENLESSPVAEKLDATIEAAEFVADALDDLYRALETAEGVDLPRGFGND